MFIQIYKILNSRLLRYFADLVWCKSYKNKLHKATKTHYNMYSYDIWKERMYLNEFCRKY